MRLEYRLSYQDYQEAYKANYKSQRTSYFFLWFLSILLVAIGFLYAIAPRSGNLMERFLGLGAICFGICLIPDLYYRFFLVSFWRNNPILREPVVLEITEEGLTYISASLQAALKWDVYAQFMETKNLFIIYPLKQIYAVLPKRSFSSLAEVSDFRKLLKNKIKKKQKRLELRISTMNNY